MPKNGASIDPDWLRTHLGNPPSGPEAVNEQRWAAVLVEHDRETYRG